MTLVIDLPDDAEQTLKDKAQAAGLSAERYAQRVLENVLQHDDGSPASSRAYPVQSAADIVLRHMRSVPDEVMDRMPADGASQHDHYIYGRPKRAE